MKKIRLLIGCVLFLFCLTGCKKEANTDAVWQEKWDKLVPLDYPNNPMATVWTEKGYYYYDERGLRYIDMKTKADMFLCSKPQCRHEGDAFCVATNQKYKIMRYCIYGGGLYALATEEAGGQKSCKLLAYALDGSEMKEIAALLTLPKHLDFDAASGTELLLHRNKALISLRIRHEGETEEDVVYSSASLVLDLETKEIIPLDEDLLDESNLPIDNLQAFGDCIYYTTERESEAGQPARITLYAYDIRKKTAEKQRLPENFGGIYTAENENAILYCKVAATELYRYDKTTEKSEEVCKFKKPYSMKETFYSEYGFSAEQIWTDGNYYYIFEPKKKINQHMVEGHERIAREQMLHIYDTEFNRLKSINLDKICGTINVANKRTVSYNLCFDLKYMAVSDGALYFFSSWFRTYDYVEIPTGAFCKIEQDMLMENLTPRPEILFEVDTPVQQKR